MEKRKTLLDYLGQVMIIFGFTMLAMNIFCLAVGDSAKDVSAIFELGSRGISTKVSIQFLCVSALMVGFRFLFFTDILLKNMPIWARTVGMLISAVVVILVFAAAFRWFPVDMWQAWAMFGLCFGLCFLGSYLITARKEKSENKRLEEALQKWKEKEEQRK